MSLSKDSPALLASGRPGSATSLNLPVKLRGREMAVNRMEGEPWLCYLLPTSSIRNQKRKPIFIPLLESTGNALGTIPIANGISGAGRKESTELCSSY